MFLVINLFRFGKRKQRNNRVSRRGRGKAESAGMERLSSEVFKSNMEKLGREAGFKWKTDVDLFHHLLSNDKVSYNALVIWQMLRLREQGAYKLDSSTRKPMDPTRRKAKLRDKAEAILYGWGIREQ